MIPKSIASSCPTPDQLNTIPVDPHLVKILSQTTETQWQNFFGFIRLNLQGRIGTKQTLDEFNKLQGQIELIPELYGLIKDILKLQ